MYQKLLKMDYSTLKLELHIMQVQKFGKINLMIPNQIYGHWDVSYMK
jgi:predicted secreted acid phosphatase